MTQSFSDQACRLFQSIARKPKRVLFRQFYSVYCSVSFFLAGEMSIISSHYPFIVASFRCEITYLHAADLRPVLLSSCVSVLVFLFVFLFSSPGFQFYLYTLIGPTCFFYLVLVFAPSSQCGPHRPISLVSIFLY